MFKISQILNNPQNIAEKFKNFAKVAKFRWIWSHWLTTASLVKGEHYFYLFGRQVFLVLVPDQRLAVDLVPDDGSVVTVVNAWEGDIGLMLVTRGHQT